MAQDRRTLRALAALLPAGTLGLSVSLAAADAQATAVADGNAKEPGSVAERLQSIRDSVSGVLERDAERRRALPQGRSREAPRLVGQRLAQRWLGQRLAQRRLGQRRLGQRRLGQRPRWPLLSAATAGATVGTTAGITGSGGNGRGFRSPHRLPQIGIVVLQPTAFCNINCSYCYLPDRDNKHVLAQSTVTRLFTELFASGWAGAAAHRDLARRRAAGRAAGLLSRGLRHHRAAAAAVGRGARTPSRPTAC